RSSKRRWVPSPLSRGLKAAGTTNIWRNALPFHSSLPIPDGSVTRISRRARKRNDIAHVGKPCRISDGALETETESRMRHGAIAAQIAIPAVVFLVELGLR